MNVSFLIKKQSFQPRITQDAGLFSFTLSGWAKGYGLPNHDREGLETPIFRLRAEVYYTNGTSEPFVADFSPCTEEWQFASVQFAKSKYLAIKYIEVFCEYSYNFGTAYFDDIQLTRDSIETNLSQSDFNRGTVL